MDNTILIGIIVILFIIIAVITVLLLKQRSAAQATSAPPPANRENSNNNINTLQPETAPPVATDSSPSVEEGIAKAQASFDAQHYDEAVIELKRFLSNNSTHSDALILLLTIYAKTNEKVEFDKLYSYIQSKADILTLQHAKEIKTSLMQGAQSTTATSSNTSTHQPSKQAPATPVVDKQPDIVSLDDEISFDDSSLNNASIQDSSLEELSFDESLSDTSTNDPAPQPSTTNNQDLSFDNNDSSEFSFDELESQLLSDDVDIGQSNDTTSSQSEPSLDASEDSTFDLSFDDDFLLDNNASSLDEPSVSNTSDSSIDTQSDDALDLSFDDEPSKQAPATKSNTEEDLFELSFDELDTKPEQETQTQAEPQASATNPQNTPKETSSDELSFNFDDDFNFDLDIEEDKPTQAVDNEPPKTVELVNDTLENNELTFEDSPATPPASNATEVSDFDDFNFDDILNEDEADDNNVLQSNDGDTDLNVTPSKADVTTESPSIELPKQDLSTDQRDQNLEQPSESDELLLDDDFSFDFEETSELEKTPTPTIEPKSNEVKDEIIDITDTDEEIVLEWDEPLDDKSSTIQPLTEDTLNERVPEDKTAKVQPQASDSIKSDSIIGNGLDDTLAQLDAMTLEEFSLDESTSSTPEEKLKDSRTIKSEPQNLKSQDINESEITSVAPKSSEQINDSFELDTSTDTSPVLEEDAPAKAKSVATHTPTTSQPSTPIDSEFAETFGFIEDLDKSQITLDLAEQYLELGEYDSAKRLVNEVLNSNSGEARKTQAQALLDRMN